MTDCKILKEASCYVRRWINKQPSVGEESLTDWLLMEVSEKIDKIKYQSFTRHQEARITGADWEWWFLYPHIAYKFRVQAKKTYVNNYGSLNYTNKHGKQIDKLINDAKNKNFIPLYAFYSNDVNITACPKGFKDEGVYLANAMELNQTLIIATPTKKIITNDDILLHSIPISCVLCCELIQIEGFDSFVDKYFKINPFSYTNGNNLGRYTVIPSYIEKILENEVEKLQDSFRKEFQLEDVNAIMIIDNRNTDNIN